MRWVLVATFCWGHSGLAAAAEFDELCANQFSSAPGLCECLAGKFENDLDDDQRRFVVASLEQKAAVTEELRQSLPFDKLTAAAMFLVTAPQQCAKGQ